MISMARQSQTDLMLEALILQNHCPCCCELYCRSFLYVRLIHVHRLNVAVADSWRSALPIEIGLVDQRTSLLIVFLFAFAMASSLKLVSCDRCALHDEGRNLNPGNIWRVRNTQGSQKNWMGASQTMTLGTLSTRGLDTIKCEIKN